MSDRVEFDVLRRVALLSARINGGRDLRGTLRAVTDGVVDVLGLEWATLSYRTNDGDFEVFAVSGPTLVRQRYDGLVIPRLEMHELLDQAEPWDELRFRPEGGLHRDGSLLAPLHSSNGEVIGVLAVPLPPALRDPALQLRELLSLFAVQAGLAIDNLRLREALRAEQLEVRRERAHLRASEAAMRFSFAQSADGMARVGLVGTESRRFLDVNDAFCELTGRSRAELLGGSWPMLLRPENAEHGHRIVGQFVDGTRLNYRTDVPIDRPDGTTVWLTLVQNRVDAEGELPPFLLVHAEDISDRRFREQELRRRAHYDDLTGLANRRTLLQALDGVVAHARTGHQTSALLFCDLNRFKPVNDRFGHAAGDQALREVAERLASLVRSDDVVGRLGGDEFLVIAKDLTRDDAEDMADRIRLDLMRPLTSVPASIGVSIGVVGIDREDEPVDVLLQRADDAMYAEKLTLRAAS